MRFLDPAHPFFRPVWVRVVVVGVALLWAVVELIFGSPGWAMLFAAAGLYALWVFVNHARDPGAPDDKG
jgi:hypothetical protein